MCDVCGSGNGRCGKCGNMCGYGRNSLLRWLLGIIIVTWIFSAGMKFGELKASIDNMGFGPVGFSAARMMPFTGGTTMSDGNVTFTSAVPAGTMKVIKSN